MARENRIIPIPAVNGAIFNQKGQILLTRRSPVIREPGKWCLPGGHLDGGEDWRTAVRREILEEIGLVVKAEKLAGIYSDPSLTMTQERLPEGHFGQFVTAVFLITDYSGDIKPNSEVDLWDWFDVDKLPDPMVKSHPIRVVDCAQFRGEVFVR